jgi:hypothetical protein
MIRPFFATIDGPSAALPVAGAVLHVDASVLSPGVGIDAAATPVPNLGSGGGAFNVGNYDVVAAGIGALNALGFDGAAQYLKTINAYSNAGDALTLFVVEQRVSAQGAWRGSVSCTDGVNNDNTNAKCFALNQDDQSPQRLMVARNLAGLAHVAHPPNGTPFVSSVRFDNINVEHRIRTSGGTLAASSGCSGTFGITSTVLGARQEPGPLNFKDTRIGEVIIYNTALSTGDREAVEDYLASKWGINHDEHIVIPSPGAGRRLILHTCAAVSPSGVPGRWAWLSGVGQYEDAAKRLGYAHLHHESGVQRLMHRPFALDGDTAFAVYIADPGRVIVWGLYEIGAES